MDLLSWFRPKQQTRAITYTQGQQAGLIAGGTHSGIVITEETALGISAVYCAVKVISEAVGSLPLVMYKKAKDGTRTTAEKHPLYNLLHDAPNPNHTRPVFFETLMSHALLYGTGYAEIERNNAGDPIALWPISPRYVLVKRDTVTGEYFYEVRLPVNVTGNPMDGGNVVTIPQEDMLAVPGIGPDGSAGYSLLKIARHNLGYSAAVDQFGQFYFGNSARLGGIITSPTELTEEARENLRTSWSQLYSGVHNTARTALLEQGLTYQGLTYDDKGGMYTTTRQFQIAEVSRLFNISPTKLHELGRATWGNLSTLNTDFYVTTLRPWLEKIEAEIERKMIGTGSNYYCEFLADAILRGDTLTRYQAYQLGITSGFLTVNEVRAWENLEPLPEPEPVTLPDLSQTPDEEPQSQEDNDGHSAA